MIISDNDIDDAVKRRVLIKFDETFGLEFFKSADAADVPAEILDMAALKAVKEAAPFYPFPSTIQREKLTIQANFIYPPNLETIAP